MASDVRPEDHGAYPSKTGVACTAEFQSAVDAAAESGLPLILSGDATHGERYVLTDTIIVPPKFVMRGLGRRLSWLEFSVSDNRPCLLISGADTCTLLDLGILGIGYHGIGLQFGSDTGWGSRNLVERLNLAYLGVGIWQHKGISNSLHGIQAYRCGTTFHVTTGQHTEVTSFVAEGFVDAAIQIDGGQVSIDGATIEGGGVNGGAGIALVADGGQVALHNAWLEDNPKHFWIGKNGTRVNVLSVQRVTFGSSDGQSVIDNVDYPDVRGLGGYIHSNKLQVGPGVRNRHMIDIGITANRNYVRTFADQAFGNSSRCPLYATDFRGPPWVGLHTLAPFIELSEIREGLTVSVDDGRMKLEAPDNVTRYDATFRIESALLDKIGWRSLMLVMRVRINDALTEFRRSAWFAYGLGEKAGNWAGQYMFPSPYASYEDGWFWIQIPFNWEDAKTELNGAPVTALHWTLGVKGNGGLLEIDYLELQPAGHTAYPSENRAMPTLDMRAERLTLAGQPIDSGMDTPTSGTWEYGAIRFNAMPTPGDPIGWVCVGGGSPGTWRPFGLVAWE